VWGATECCCKLGGCGTVSTKEIMLIRRSYSRDMPMLRRLMFETSISSSDDERKLTKKHDVAGCTPSQDRFSVLV